MKVTFTLRDLSSEYFEGMGESLKGLNNMSDREKFDMLHRGAFGELKQNIKILIGTGQFRERIELTQLLRGQPSIEYKLEPRKGYKLATFVFK